MATSNLEDKEKDVTYEVSSYLMKGIDFLGDEKYLEEDIRCIKEHPTIFSNFYTDRKNLGRNLKIVKYAVSLFKYYKRSFHMYVTSLKLDCFDALCQLMQKECDTWKEIVLMLSNFVVDSNVCAFEQKLYDIRKGVADNDCVKYNDNLYVFKLEYNIKSKKNEESFYIVKKEDDNMKIYMLKNVYIMPF